MRLAIVLESRFARTPDGAVWTEMGLPHAFWQRYLEVFDSVSVIARVLDVRAVGSYVRRVDGQRVTVHGLPYYLGPWQYLRAFWALRRSMREALLGADAIILRGPGALAGMAIDLLRRSRQPYGLEVVGDPHDVFAPGVVRHPLRPVLRWWFTRRQRQHCRNAAAVLYVTARALQRRYPAIGFTTHASNVELTDDAFVIAPDPARDVRDVRLRIAFVGSLAQLYKGPDVLLHALHICLGEGLDLCLTMIGDGRHRRDVEALVEKLGLRGRVELLGVLPNGAAVRRELDQADLFVLPSLTEGMPRAMIEAMARGLPCIGTMVGGIPELLPADCLVPAGRPNELAACIASLVRDPMRRDALARSNVERAREYHDSELQQRRAAFYRDMVHRSVEWRAAGGRP